MAQDKSGLTWRRTEHFEMRQWSEEEEDVVIWATQ